MDIYIDSYFWYRGIGCDHSTAVRLAKRESLL